MERTLDTLRAAYRGKLYTVHMDMADALQQGWSIPSNPDTGDYVALECGRRISHVGFVGHMAVQCGAATVVDYARWKVGREDYLISSSSGGEDVIEQPYILGDRAAEAEMWLADHPGELDEAERLFSVIVVE